MEPHLVTRTGAVHENEAALGVARQRALHPVRQLTPARPELHEGRVGGQEAAAAQHLEQSAHLDQVPWPFRVGADLWALLTHSSMTQPPEILEL